MSPPTSGLRAEPVARYQGIAAHHAITLFDLSGTFDHQDPAQFKIAAWDDHPNAPGHRRLFLALSRALVRGWYRGLFWFYPSASSPIRESA